MAALKRQAARLTTIGTSIGAAVAMLIGGGQAASADSSMPFNNSTWGCNTSVSSSSVQLIFQCDGNLVLYRNSDHHALWASGTSGRANTPNTVQWTHINGMGRISIETGWATVCEAGGGDGATTAVVQDDGNFVAYGSGGAVWASNTAGSQQGNLDECGW